MDESFSPAIFLYGMALVFAVGKAFTLTIWRTPPRPRPGLRQEMPHAWKDRRLWKQVAASRSKHPQKEQTADNPLANTNEAKGEPHAAAPTPEKDAVRQPRPNANPEK
jgi:hypothetical protein